MRTTARLVPLVALVGCNHPHAGKPEHHDHVATVTFHSDALGVDKDFVIYLPTSYDRTPKHYPVFYYLHGLGDDETHWRSLGLDAAADALALEAIVVMPDGDNSFYIDSPAPADYDACMRDGTGLLVPSAPRDKTCVRANKYDTYITRDLVGYIDAHYRTIASREGRAIAGLSMGGYGALELAMRHTDEFSAAASHSGMVALLYHMPHPYDAAKVELTQDVTRWGIEAGEIGAWIRSWFGTDRAFWEARDPAALLAKLAPGQLALYLDCGTEDRFLLHDQAAYVHDLLTAKHLDHEFFLGPGGHNGAFWTARVPNSLAFLRDHVARPQ
jgi:S-formylglutathione hydrolase FrmB